MKNNQEIDIFCQNVKMLRERNGLSKKETSEILGICTASLTKIERGILPPGISTSIIFKLCKEFDIEPRKLFMPL